MMRAHRIKLNPTEEQAAYFWRCCGVARFTWNWALGEYNNALARGEKPSLAALKREFNRKRADDGFAPFVGEVQSYAYQYAFMDLQAALSRYHKLRKDGRLKPPAGWKPRKDGKPFGWPRFKARNRSTPAFGLANNGGMVFDGHNIRIQRCPGIVNMAEPLRLDGRVMGGRVSYTGGRWYLSVQVEVADPEPLALSGAVGIDMGIRYRAVTSDGEVFDNPRALQDAQRKLAKLQRSASRMWEMNGRKPTSNWRKIQGRIARLHARIADIRRENSHQITTSVARRYAVVGVEDLYVKGMVKNHRLARAVLDAGMRQIREQFAYKVPAAGGELVAVDRFFASSKRCSTCGHTVTALPLSVRQWACPECGSEHERDGNAAINIRDEALRMVEGSG